MGDFWKVSVWGALGSPWAAAGIVVAARHPGLGHPDLNKTLCV